TKWRWLYEFQRLVSDVMPELVTMENVPQLSNHKVVEGCVSALMTRGYNLWYDVVRCSEYGCLHNGRRLILFGYQLWP
ncbi:DNA cytosine methyltransferase, partial [Escherichia coli]|nr:DNA cytosine methyltransferase [Escherichia coli]